MFILILNLFSQDFKEVKTYEFDIMGLQTIKDENS